MQPRCEGRAAVTANQRAAGAALWNPGRAQAPARPFGQTATKRAAPVCCAASTSALRGNYRQHALLSLGNLVWRPRAESNRRGKDVPDSAQLIRKFSAKSRQIDLATSRTTAPWPRFLRILGICAICHARLRKNCMKRDATCLDCVIVLAACAAMKVRTRRSPPLALRFSVHPDRR